MIAFCAAARAPLEPDQRLLVPPAGGGGDARPGDRLRAGHRHRRARRGAGLGPGRPRSASRRSCASISFFVQRRHPLRRGDLQDPGLRRAVGPHLPRALRRDRREGPPLPLRRAGQLARPHRGAAGEQHAAHRAGDARRHAVEAGPGPLDPAAGVERGARPAHARGTSSGRCASSRCWPSRPTCSSTATSSTARRWSRPRTAELVEAAEAELDEVARAGRRLRGDRRDEGPAGALATPSACAASSRAT